MTETNSHQLLKACLSGQKVSRIKAFNINDEYYVFDRESQVAVDGGIMLETSSGAFCLGFNEDMECFDLMEGTSPKALFGGLEYFEVPLERMSRIQNLMGLSIVDFQINWVFYEELAWNEKVEPIKNYVPLEILLYFERNHFLQIACMDFELDAKSHSMTDPSYSLTGSIVVNAFEKIELEKP
jgi:hypothetical protein